jgi:hypothetical protein
MTSLPLASRSRSGWIHRRQFTPKPESEFQIPPGKERITTVRRLLPVLLAGLMALSASPATAQHRADPSPSTLSGRPARGTLVPIPGAQWIAVWKDFASMKEGLQLAMQDVHKSNPAVMLPLVRCIAAPRTRAVVTEVIPGAYAVTLIDGTEAGCRGFIFETNLNRY